MLRQLAKTATTTVARQSQSQTRAFHSPFAVLSKSPSTPLTTTANTTSNYYEKALESSPDPLTNPNSTRTYVVSSPDPSNTPYEVPSGAYPNASPYENPPRVVAANGEDFLNTNPSSTSVSPAHPTTTSTTAGMVDRNDVGVGESSAVRFRSAPGEMGKRGGGSYGEGLGDEETTVRNSSKVGERNPPPLSKEAEGWSKGGLKDAWKKRK
jgi:hypothetical protein